MSETAWFRRGDGAEFEVPVASEAYAQLVARGAIRLEKPGATPDEDGGADAPAPPTKAELRERAAELGLDLPGRATNAELSAAIAAEEQRRADEATAAASSSDAS